MENLLALLLQARDVAHIHHWKVKSFSLHMALGELYELLNDFTDALAEMAMGANQDIGSPQFDTPTGWPKDNPILFVSYLHSSLEDLKPTLPQFDWLINKYEELQGEVARVKYKMENLR